MQKKQKQLLVRGLLLVAFVVVGLVASQFMSTLVPGGGDVSGYLKVWMTYVNVYGDTHTVYQSGTTVKWEYPDPQMFPTYIAVSSTWLSSSFSQKETSTIDFPEQGKTAVITMYEAKLQIVAEAYVTSAGAWRFYDHQGVDHSVRLKILYRLLTTRDDLYIAGVKVDGLDRVAVYTEASGPDWEVLDDGTLNQHGDGVDWSEAGLVSPNPAHTGVYCTVTDSDDPNSGDKIWHDEPEVLDDAYRLNDKRIYLSATLRPPVAVDVSDVFDWDSNSAGGRAMVKWTLVVRIFRIEWREYNPDNPIEVPEGDEITTGNETFWRVIGIDEIPSWMWAVIIIVGLVVFAVIVVSIARIISVLGVRRRG